MMTLRVKVNYFLGMILLALFFSSCDEREEYIPFVYVDFYVDLNINNDLTTPGNSTTYPYEGYGGVIVYCEYYDYLTPNKSLFHAYDATCTYEVSDTCRVVVGDGDLYGECPYCHSKYDLVTGYPFEGVARYSLKSYSTFVMNNRVYVTNYK